MNKCFIIIFASLFSHVYGQETQSKEVIKEEAKEDGLQSKKSGFFENAKGNIQELIEMRDPFKRKRIRLKSRDKSYGGFLRDSSYSNLPAIDGVPLNQIRVVGILLGKQRRAIAKIMEGDKLGNDAFILKEGMSLGENKAEIKAILPGGIVLVEKIQNVYDQDEYIETIIPVSTQVN